MARTKEQDRIRKMIERSKTTYREMMLKRFGTIEAIKEYQTEKKRRSRLLNPDTGKAWRDRNKDKAQRWNKNNPERYSELLRNWKQKNKEKCNESAKKWVKEHPEKAKAIRKKQRIKKNSLMFSLQMTTFNNVKQELQKGTK